MLRATRGDAAWGNHTVLLVDADGRRWLADAGIGDGFLDPLPLREGVHEQHGFTYRLDRLDDETWRFVHHPRGSIGSYDFRREPRELADFEGHSHRLATSPESPYVTTLVVARPRGGPHAPAAVPHAAAAGHLRADGERGGVRRGVREPARRSTRGPAARPRARCRCPSVGASLRAGRPPAGGASAGPTSTGGEAHDGPYRRTALRRSAFRTTMGAVPTDDAPLHPTSHYRNVLQHAEAEARRRGHQHLGPEHLLLGILDTGESAATAAIAKFVDVPTIRRELERVLASETYARDHPGPVPHPRATDERSDTVPVLLVRGEERQRAVIRWWWIGRGPDDVYRAELEWSGPALEVSAHDMFDALVRFREQLEPEGWFVAVQGSRLDTYPSAMQRDMGGGLSVYVIRMGEPARSSDVVDTFAEADPALLATVEDQRRHAEEWSRSVEGAAAR